jgi:carboxymethylenebutenolidase
MMMQVENYKKTNSEEMLEDFIAAYNYLKAHKDCNGHIVVGFVLRMDCQHDGGKIPTCAAVPYYGGQPTAAPAELIKLLS